MNEHERPSAASDDDADARRERAERLREEIDRLKKGEPPAEPAAPPSPREFTERSVREDLEREGEAGKDE